MRIIFESERIPVTAIIPSGAESPLAGTTTNGVAWLCILTFEQGEVIPREHDHARPVARVLERLAPGEPHRSPMPSVFAALDGDPRDVAVPRSLFTSLPLTTIIGIDWEFKPTSAKNEHARGASPSDGGAGRRS
jgi:hypothetical protein